MALLLRRPQETWYNYNMYTCTYLHHKSLVNVLLSDAWLEVWTLKEPQEELIHNLEVRPRRLQGWLVLFWVVFCSRGVCGRGEGSKGIRCKLELRNEGRREERGREGGRKEEKKKGRNIRKYTCKLGLPSLSLISIQNQNQSLVTHCMYMSTIHTYNCRYTCKTLL